MPNGFRFVPVLGRVGAAELAAVAGSYGRHAAPMEPARRQANYMAQTGRQHRVGRRRDHLTPRQRRRDLHKARRHAVRFGEF